MRTFLALASLCSLLSTAWTGACRADVANKPVSFRTITAPSRIVAGQTHGVVIEMAVRYPAAVSDVRYAGSGWGVSPIKRSLKETKGPVDIYRLTFDLVAADPSQPLEFSYRLNGERIATFVDLSESRPTRLEHVPVEELAVRPAKAAAWIAGDEFDLRLEPFPVDPRWLEDPDEAGPAPGAAALVKAKSAKLYHITGNFAFWRSDTTEVPGYGMTVLAIADTWGPDTVLGSAIVMPDGSFEIDAWWWYDPLPVPPVHLLFTTANGYASVTQNDDWVGYVLGQAPYTWATTSHTLDDSGLDLPYCRAGGRWTASIYILGNVMRTANWLFRNSGYSSIAYVEVEWPSPDETSNYEDYWNWLNITDSRSWHESTHTHEYGHHIHYCCGTVGDMDRCNDFCEAGGCDHTNWCRESADLAWGEGLPYYIADAVCREMESRYGIIPVHVKDYEIVDRCRECGENQYHWPYITEGFTAALLRDIEDPGNESDPVSPGFQDRLDMDARDVLDIALVPVDYINQTTGPTSVHQFIERFLEAHPDKAYDFYETCMNSGLGQPQDTTPPHTNALNSSSHAVGVESTNNSVDLSWSAPLDDFSGPGGYNLTITPGYAPTSPASSGEPGIRRNVFATTVEDLAAGAHTFAIRAMDRAGNWDPEFQTFGPVIIRQPDPGDLHPQSPGAGWDFPIVPKDTPSATLSTVAADAQMLYSNTYWNASVTNIGEQPTPSARATVLIDGIAGPSHTFGLLLPDEHISIINQGPISIRGGRHTFEYFVDSAASLAEANERNNRYGHQWIWIPELLTPGAVHTRPHPPLRDGGFSSVPVEEQLRWYNCDGLNLMTLEGGVASPWALVAAHTVSNADDVDLWLHEAPTGPQDGFDIPLAASGRPEGYLDAVIVNAANRPRLNYVVGVVNNHPYGAGGDYRAQVEYGQALASAVPHAGSFVVGQGLDLFTFTAPAAGPIRVDFQLDWVVDAPPIYIAWYNEDFATGTLLDYDAVAVTEFNGSAHLDIDAAAGVHGLVLWRDPVETGYGNHTYTLTVGPPQPDLACAQPVGWSAPLVPAAAPTVTPTDGPDPTVLYGDQANTYLNLAMTNASPTAAPPCQAGGFVDGELVQEHQLGSLAGGSTTTIIPSGPVTVRGGRHTLSMMVDSQGGVVELDEGNNRWGRQFVWSPAGIAAGVGVVRPYPPDRTAGWALVGTGEDRYDNCDGVALPLFYPTKISHWMAAAVMPGGASDVDLRLHAPHGGTHAGFDSVLVQSTWPAAQSDFVLVHASLTGPVVYEAGVVRGGTIADEDYVINATRSLSLGTDPRAVVRDGAFNPNQLVSLYEFTVTMPTNFVVSLDTDEPTLDLGVSVYGPADGYMAKDEVFTSGGASWQAPAGATETINFQVDGSELGGFCLAVWKAGSADAPISGGYSLTIDAAPVLPDAMVHAPVGWAAPLVPRAEPGTNGNWAPLPASIPGDYAATYFNFAITTGDLIDPTPFEYKAVLDNHLIVEALHPGGNGGIPQFYIDLSPRMVTGGRHTVALLVDEADDLIESDESNNVYGTQHVWTPRTMGLNSSHGGTDPDPFFAGWEHITVGGVAWYNCNASRTPVFDPGENPGTFRGLAVIPESISDPELRLHPIAAGFGDGITTPLATSNFPAGHSDFILVDLGRTQLRQFDIAVATMEDNNEELTISNRTPEWVGAFSGGSLGTETITYYDAVELFEIEFATRGSYHLELIPADANCDLGVSLYGGSGAAYYAKSDVFDDGVNGEAVSFTNPPGAVESFDFIIDAPGTYCVVVWKVGSDDYWHMSRYDLTLQLTGVSDVAEHPAARQVTRLAGAYPNPFNPKTTVAFELDESRHVRLEIFDLRGRLVRVLVDEALPGGRHERDWMGQDDSHRSVSSGVYVIRMTAGGFMDLKRVSLLK